METMSKQPLVSVTVITYNSSSYIISGLESVKEQTYPNIELIVSDDCSTDNTVEVVQRWLDENGSRFVRTQLVTTDKNTGVAGNCNRARRACKGEWIKGLSGDDKFLPYTIERYVHYVNEHPEAKICFAKLHFWGENEEETNHVREVYEKSLYPKIKSDDVKHQYREILKEMYVPGPGLFIKKDLYLSVGGFDEKYPFSEEWPFTLRVLKAGNRIYFIDEELYGYQVRADSICRGSSKTYKLYTKNVYSYFKDERARLMFKKGLLLDIINQYLFFNIQISFHEQRLFLYYLFKSIYICYTPLYRMLIKIHPSSC
jgi:alpha-1,3-rhamnosyltransferase